VDAPKQKTPWFPKGIWIVGTVDPSSRLKILNEQFTSIVVQDHTSHQELKHTDTPNKMQQKTNSQQLIDNTDRRHLF